RRYYGAAGMPGQSVPATEHSVCTLLGAEGELDVFRHALHTYPDGILSVVSDSYDIFRACTDYWGGALRDQVLARNGTLVIRPDSGDPVFTLLRVFDLLLERFGFTVNEKGYKVLPPQVRVLQGDGINPDSVRAIYGALQLNGISAENLVLGMGGALLQKVDRDTQKFALKCSWAEVAGRGRDVRKQPVELDAKGSLHRSFKESKGGRLKLVLDDDGYRTVREGAGPALNDELLPVFENGVLLNEQRYDDIRARALAPQEKVCFA
ncbi:MAG: nicotinate phosphoribosyltransferase, partial [Chitinophagaceae bacterium]